MNDLGFERDIAPLVGAHVRHGYRPGRLRCEISLIEFLMASLRWPEVKAAAEERFNDGGNACHAREMQELIDICNAV